MKKTHWALLALALLGILALLPFHLSGPWAAPGNQAQGSASTRAPGPSGKLVDGAPDKEPLKPGAAARPVSPASWRPPHDFAKTGKPTPPQVYPRGVHASRRYSEAVRRDLHATPQQPQALALAKSPEDGRFHLLPEEIDVHTRAAARMVFDPAALEPILNGSSTRLLAPTLTEEVLTLEFKTIRTRSATTHTLQGHIAGEETTSLVQVVYHDGILHGSVRRYSTDQEIEYRILADGHMMVRELDIPAMTAGCEQAPEKNENAMEALGIEAGQDAIILNPGEIIQRSTTGSRTVDVVVGYDQEARIADGGYAGIEARIIAAVDRMNTAFINSGIANAEIMLLGTIEDPDYRYSDSSATNMGAEIANLRTETDGPLDTVTDFSNRLGADFVSFIIWGARGGTAGVASAGKYTVVARTYMTAGRLVFAHELGHNLGCTHAWSDTNHNVDNSRYGWRFKSPDTGNKYATIMAYDGGWGGATIPYYSNPNILYDGAKTGAVNGYNVLNDTTVDPQMYSEGGFPGFDGTHPLLGANNAEVIDVSDATIQGGIDFNAARTTRSAFSVISPAAAAQWERGTAQVISFNGGDMQDLVTIKLYKGGVLHSTLASDVNPATNRNFRWTVPFGLANGTDYMIRVELTSNGSTLIQDSGIFEIFSLLPHVIAQATTTTPAGIGATSQLVFTFNVPMNLATFSAGSDIVSFIDPTGTSVAGSITGTSWSAGDTVLTIQFTPPSLQGSYQMMIGPDIEDTVGNKMDQDDDGTTGESVEDRYTANFTVNPPLIYYANMDTDPGWTFSANNPTYGWKFGQPTGGTGQAPDGVTYSIYSTQYGIKDPTAGYNGPNVMGYNLNGDYERGITSTRWATTPAIDCSSYQNVTLSFQRWLGVYNGTIINGINFGDHVYIEVSNDGTNWTNVWNNDNIKVDTAAWTEVQYDISAVADGQPSVFIRWGMGKTNSSINDDSCGWNIDDVIVHGNYVDNSDITPPYPSPMTFATPPTALGVSAITMTATTALDANGVEYYFAETSGNPGGTDSGWQNSPTYTDTGLQAGTQYTYTVKARDKSPGQNETGASTPAAATTDAGPTLTLIIAATSIGESGGPGATTATVTRNTDTSSSLVVNLSSNDTTETTVPATVTIAAGQSTSPVFVVNAVDDAIIDGTQSITLTATAAGHANGSDTIDVTDDVPLTLTVITGTNGASTNGGGLKDPDGSPYAITATPAAGFSLANWTVIAGDATFDNENNASTTVAATGDATVQANFVVASYAVTYAGNGSDGGSVPVDASSPYPYNNTVTVLGNTGALTRAGYSFTGWNTASNGSGTSYVGGSAFSITGNTTLYAQWTATITLGNLSQVYDGTPKSALVTTNPPGLDHTVTYNGSATAPTNAGSYAVVATITDPSYSGSASGSLVIAKASQTITFGALSPVPDTASPFALTATASSGLAVAYTSSNLIVATVSGSTVTVVGLGDTTITASQTGNSNYNTATPVAQTLTVNRGNPVAIPGGPYKVLVGQSLALNASASLPSDGQTISAYDWDLNNDGTFGDVTGVTPPAITDSALASTWGMLDGLNTIQLKITDSAGKTSTVSTTVELIVGLTWDANTSSAGVQDGTGAWIGENWWDGTGNQTWSSGSAATFGNGGTGGAVTLASPTTVKKLTFNTFTGTYTLGTIGQMLTINSGINKTSGSAAVTFLGPITLGGDQTWTNNSSGTLLTGKAANLIDNGGHQLTIDGTGTTAFGQANTDVTLTGSGALVKSGSGRLNVGGVNTGFTGTVTINGGVLQALQDVNALGNGNVTLDGGVLSFYWTMAYSRTLGPGTNQIQLLGGESGFGDQGSSATINLGSSVVWGAAGEGAATGYFNPAKFVLGDASTANNGSTNFSNGIDLNGATRSILVPYGTTTPGNISTMSAAISNSTGTAGLIKEGDGTLILSAVNTYTGPTTISGGILRIGNNTTGTLNSGNYAGNISIASGATLQIWSSAAQTLSGIISGDGGLHKAYGGALTLSGPNTYTGRTSFLPQTSAGCNVNITSFNSVNGGTPTLLSSSLGAPTTIANGTIDIGNSGKQAGVNLTYSGSGETTDRVINFGFNGTASQTLTASGSGLLKFTSPMTSNATTQTGKLILDGTGSGEITQILPALPTGGLTKNGTGTWTLGGSNTYTGPTAITAGKLFINGDQSLATGSVSVSTSATLGGTGTLGGNTTIADTGKLEFSLSTAPGSHDKLELAAGKTLSFDANATLTINSVSGATTGDYILISAPGGIGALPTFTLNLPSGWSANVTSENSNTDLVLHVTSVGDTVDHFAISSIASPQTVGTPITGITITAQDAANATVTSFTGTVTFGGTADITGASANFVSGVLSGVSVTPTVAGLDLDLTVNDGFGHTGSTTFTVRSVFDTWASGSGLVGGDAAFTANPDGDSLTNLLEFAFGMNPTSPTLTTLTYTTGGTGNPGLPILENTGTTQSPIYRAVFARRKDYLAANLTYTVEFSANLTHWKSYATNHLDPVSGTSATAVEAVALPFPLTVPLTAAELESAPPKFFRLAVREN